jgi:predicted AAA+ superfamily ATPase
VGKTVSLRRKSRTVFSVDDPGQRALLEADPGRVERAAPPVLIDEWQRLPQLWDLVRRFVDERRVPGRFLLAGSAAPIEVPVHSGAGRIVSVRMRPLSLAERGLAPAKVSLAQLLSGSRPAIDAQSDVDLVSYANEIVSSGFPAIRVAPSRARRALLDGYLDRVAQHEIPDQGLPVRRPQVLMAWMRAYAAATAQDVSYNRILDAATPGDGEKPARSTTEQYRQVLNQLWILDPLPAWLPSRNPLNRLAQAPKHHLADPALAARLLGVEVDALVRGDSAGPPTLRDDNLLGRLFESLVTLSVRVYAQAAEARVYHLRTRNGDHEVDLIVTRDDGRLVAVEVKLSPVVNDDDVKHLRWLSERVGDDLLDAIVITAGEHAYRRPDGIGVVPAACLGV